MSVDFGPGTGEPLTITAAMSSSLSLTVPIDRAGRQARALADPVDDCPLVTSLASDLGRRLQRSSRDASPRARLRRISAPPIVTIPTGARGARMGPTEPFGT